MTAKTGFLGKQLSLAATPVQVMEEDCGADRIGVLMQGEHDDILGRITAKDVGNIPTGTPITKELLPKIQGKNLLVRSVITCQATEGVCRKCARKIT
jgi:DNA-directed RNA polymerase subunit beta'